MTKMNPEWKAKWLAALRSGEFKQGNGYLNRDGGFCCLGVLCELVAREGQTTKHVDEDGATHYARSGRCASLPYEIVELTGMVAWGSFGDFEIDSPFLSGATSLSAANDQGATFQQIADFIEKEF